MNDLVNLYNRVIDKDGNVVYFPESLIELMYKGEIPSEILFPKDDPDVVAFNRYAYENYDELEYKLPEKLLTHNERKNDWFYPDSYDQINLIDYFAQRCSTKEQVERVLLELELYQQKGFEKFLRCCIFLSDKINENKWVIGVGRGSSCASYLLYLLKIHLVDSLKYNLDIREFLK